MTFTLAWPDLSALLASFMARIGSPLQLARLMLNRAQARDLSRQLSLMEIKVRARLNALFARFATSSTVAALLLEQLAAIAGKPRPPQARSTPASRRAADSEDAVRPSFAQLTVLPGAASTRRPLAPRATNRPKPASVSTAQVSALPLARRLAALDLAISQPEETALRLLAARPALAFQHGAAPQPPEPATLTDTPATQAPAAPLNRRQRRAQQAQRKADSRRLARLRAPDTS